MAKTVEIKVLYGTTGRAPDRLSVPPEVLGMLQSYLEWKSKQTVEVCTAFGERFKIPMAKASRIEIE